MDRAITAALQARLGFVPGTLAIEAMAASLNAIADSPEALAAAFGGGDYLPSRTPAETLRELASTLSSTGEDGDDAK